MVHFRQDVQTRLLVDDSKFEPSKACLICGKPTRTAAVKCLPCLEAAYLAEELAYARAYVREHPGTRIELGYDRHKLVHLVLLRSPVRNLGWCGARVTQVKGKRTKVEPAKFPEGICVKCRMAYQGVAK